MIVLAISMILLGDSSISQEALTNIFHVICPAEDWRPNPHRLNRQYPVRRVLCFPSISEHVYNGHSAWNVFTLDNSPPMLLTLLL